MTTFTLSSAGGASMLPGGIVYPATDPAFHYTGYGMVSASADTGVAGSLIGNYNPSTDDRASAQVTFQTNSQQIEVRVQSYSIGTLYYRVWENGVPSSVQMVTVNPFFGGAKYYLLVDRGTSPPATITLELAGIELISIACAAGKTITAGTTRRERVAIMGDSFCTRQGGSPTTNTPVLDIWPFVAARALGWDVFVMGNGGTGYLATGGSTNYLDHFSSQITALDAVLPLDRVIFSGGFNDRGLVPADVAANAALLFAKCAAEIPHARRAIVLPFSPHGGALDTTVVAIRDALRPVADAAGIPYIDAINYLNGGNAAAFIGADGTHMTFAGHQAIGALVAADLGLALAAAEGRLMFAPLTPDTLLAPDTLLGPDGVYIHTMAGFRLPLHTANDDGAPPFHGDCVLSYVRTTSGGIPARVTGPSIAARVTSGTLAARTTSVVVG